MDGIENMFISPSSIGYLFGAAVSFMVAYKMYKRWRITQMQTTKSFIIAFVYMGITVALYALPTFFYSNNPLSM